MKLNPKSSLRVPAGPGHHPGLALLTAWPWRDRAARQHLSPAAGPRHARMALTIHCYTEMRNPKYLFYLYMSTHTLQSPMQLNQPWNFIEWSPCWRFYTHKMGCGAGHIVPAEGQGSHKPCPAGFSPPLPLTTLPLSSRGLLGILSLQGSQLNSSLGHANICQRETRQMGSLKRGLTVKHPGAPNP